MTITNPLFEEWVLHSGNQLSPTGKVDMDAYLRQLSARGNCCRKYSFAVPSPESLEWLVQFGPFVEIGAGRGYWASLLQKYGAEIVCYDSHPPDVAKNDWVGDAVDSPEVFTKVQLGGPEVLSSYTERTLFLCWPPLGDNPMSEECLKMYTGNRLVYIGEPMGGCTGTDVFWNILEKEWMAVHWFKIPKWQGIHDMITVFERQL